MAEGVEHDYEGLLARFYADYAPDKASNVAKILTSYKGREATLLKFLERKYKKPGYFQKLQLDVASPLFNPLLALRSSGVRLPAPRVRALDNLSRCRVLLPASCPDSVAAEIERGGGRRARPKATPTARQAPRERPGPSPRASLGPGAGAGGGAAPPRSAAAADAQRDAPASARSQASGAGAGARVGARGPPQPLTSRSSGTAAGGRQKKQKKDLLESIADSCADGPLRVLHKCFQQRGRVRVTLRRIDGVRGTATGYLKAFDKHMNMVLLDVDEVYIPSPQRGQHSIRLHDVPGGRPSASCFQRRHLNQVLLRGDCVVMVGAASDFRPAADAPP